MEDKKLRQYDFVTAIGLIIFSLWELTEANKMPMNDSYGGVQNDWYVSPALLPLFIGGGILLLGIILLINSIRTGGAKSFVESLKTATKMELTIPTKRVLTVLLGLGTFIFILIPNIDFFLSINLFLFYICAAFYPDIEKFRTKMTLQFLVGAVVLAILAFTGVAKTLNGAFSYTMDIVVLLYIIYINIYSRLKSRGFDIPKGTFRKITIVSIIVPLILCPIFRYFLLVPLPVEGGIIKLMNLLYYTLR